MAKAEAPDRTEKGFLARHPLLKLSGVIAGTIWVVQKWWRSGFQSTPDNVFRHPTLDQADFEHMMRRPRIMAPRLPTTPQPQASMEGRPVTHTKGQSDEPGDSSLFGPGGLKKFMGESS